MKLAGVEKETIYGMTRTLLTDAFAYQAMARAVNPYGDGRASARIRDAIAFHFGLKGEAPADFGG